MGRGAETDIDLKAKIITQVTIDNGKYLNAAKKFGVTPSRVRSVWRAYQKTGSIFPAERSGRPLERTARSDRALIKLAKKNRTLSANQLSKLFIQENKGIKGYGRKNVEEILHGAGFKFTVCSKSFVQALQSK
ncbi:uncharacterized protein FA14DRAFT_180283 [Meira miltonrushii]|uniref:Uncharacterized protein n=1 Tax=Meira miltonrushii TaxID=1280837 RepID=A0A316V7Z7_9BASI|nr:uncharacterized protein FA14DRAFT_180283 [Meira miltonrushii]PWN33646.1 hypothetical protein FA14DRAFT_180283 [Meira miltonrushii]